MGDLRPLDVVLTIGAAVLFVVSLGGVVRGGTEPAQDSIAGSRTGVAIVDFTFLRAPLTIEVGESVTWTNHDRDPHTVTSDGEGPLDSAALNQDETYEVVFDRAGSYDYLCTIHPGMRGTVEVTE